MQSLRSCHSEWRVRGMVKTIGAASLSYSWAQLTEILSESEICRTRMRQAMPHLSSEYGSGDSIPAHEIIDRVFGLDMVVAYKGRIIGLDITLNPDAIDSKVAKMKRLRPLYGALYLDNVGVIHVTGRMDERSLRSAIEAIARSSTPVAVQV